MQNDSKQLTILDTRESWEIAEMAAHCGLTLTQALRLSQIWDALAALIAIKDEIAAHNLPEGLSGRDVKAFQRVTSLLAECRNSDEGPGIRLMPTPFNRRESILIVANRIVEELTFPQIPAQPPERDVFQQFTPAHIAWAAARTTGADANLCVYLWQALAADHSWETSVSYMFRNALGYDWSSDDFDIRARTKKLSEVDLTDMNRERRAIFFLKLLGLIAE